MKKTFELNENDIVNILSEKFKISADRIYITYEDITVGYGVAEHCEPQIKILIKEEE